jgi:hypothetical protein
VAIRNMSILKGIFLFSYKIVERVDVRRPSLYKAQGGRVDIFHRLPVTGYTLRTCVKEELP